MGKTNSPLLYIECVLWRRCRVRVHLPLLTTDCSLTQLFAVIPCAYICVRTSMLSVQVQNCRSDAVSGTITRPSSLWYFVHFKCSLDLLAPLFSNCKCFQEASCDTVLLFASKEAKLLQQEARSGHYSVPSPSSSFMGLFLGQQTMTGLRQRKEKEEE